ncbi:MAG TPA: pyridoxamine 5'-phosphate oxidase family protein [Dehalococcoidia bacterium]|nr:pyridoxamine 5'-phosphate oxidase family protein [Dehalococcoidia bacterium]
MGSQFTYITDEQTELIRNSPVFFVASAASDLSAGPEDQGPVNLSPKGATPLHVIDANHVAYLDYRGSGNETARHAASEGPVTVMIMSMGKEDAGIIRLYGHAKVVALEESSLADELKADASETIGLAMRQVVEVTVESTQTSCGYGVPVFEFVEQRTKFGRGRRYKPARAEAKQPSS